MNITKFKEWLFFLKKALQINLNDTIIVDGTISILFYSVAFLFVVGMPISGWDGLFTLITKIAHSQYNNLNIQTLLNKEYTFTILFLHSLIVSLLSLLFFFIYVALTKTNFKKIFSASWAILLYLFRMISLLYVSLLIFIPLFFIKLFNNNLFNQNVSKVIPMNEVLTESTIMFIGLILLLLCTSMQFKKVETHLQLESRKWAQYIKKRFSMVAFLPIVISMCFYSNFLFNNEVARRMMNEDSINENICKYITNSPQINNAIKMAFIEDNCEKVPQCNKFKDEYVVRQCLKRIYMKSHAFLDFLKMHPNGCYNQALS